MSNKETEESAMRLEAIYDQIEKEASEAALMWPWGYSQKDYEDGKPRPAMEVNAVRKEYYKRGATPYAEKWHETNEENIKLNGSCKKLFDQNCKFNNNLVDAKTLLTEVFQKHVSGLLPDRLVYDKIKMFLYGE